MGLGLNQPKGPARVVGRPSGRVPFLRCGPGPADTWGTNRDRLGAQIRVNANREQIGLESPNREKTRIGKRSDHNPCCSAEVVHTRLPTALATSNYKPATSVKCTHTGVHPRYTQASICSIRCSAVQGPSVGGPLGVWGGPRASTLSKLWAILYVRGGRFA